LGGIDSFVDGGSRWIGLGDIWRSGHGISEDICGTITAVLWARETAGKHRIQRPIAQTYGGAADDNGLFFFFGR